MKQIYQEPQVEALSCKVERGFLNSPQPSMVQLNPNNSNAESSTQGGFMGGEFSSDNADNMFSN